VWFLFRLQNDPRALAHFQVCIRINEQRLLERRLANQEPVLRVALERTRVSLGLTDDLADGIIAKQIIELAKAPKNVEPIGSVVH